MTGSIFTDTQGLYQRRRAFNMSYRNDLTCNLGEILPVYLQDLIPNTSWAARVHALVRFLPLAAPILTNVDLYVHFWQAPYRILYGEDFTHVITGELEAEDWPGVFWTPQDIWNFLQANVPAGADHDNIVNYLISDGSLFDVLGYDKVLLTEHKNGKINARKFIMYMRLMHDWYSNENVEPWTNFLEVFDWKNILEISDAGSGNISSLIGLFVFQCYNTWKTAGFFAHQWPKDYLTTALPTLQYGLPTYLPLGTTAPVVPNGDNPQALRFTSTGLPGSYGQVTFNLDGLQSPGTKTAELYNGNGVDSADVVLSNVDGSMIESIDGRLVPVPGDTRNAPFVADLSAATAITINELRISNALQVFKEREMRYGRKPQEYYRGFYGVTPGDLRLQMPKFLGGGRMPINISDIEQTSETTSTSQLGKLAGKGTGIAAGFARAHCFAPEETFVMGVAWIMPKVLYAQALSRHDTKLNDRFDYYNPSFAHIGEQPVYNYEAYAGSYGTTLGSTEFGYQPRYTEYRFHNSEIHGDLKGSLSYWTLARIFDSQPALNANFIYMQPEVLNRIFAVRTALVGIQRNVILSIQFQAACIQPLSRYGTPGLMP